MNRWHQCWRKPNGNDRKKTTDEKKTKQSLTKLGERTLLSKNEERTVRDIHTMETDLKRDTDRETNSKSDRNTQGKNKQRATKSLYTKERVKEWEGRTNDKEIKDTKMCVEIVFSSMNFWPWHLARNIRKRAVRRSANPKGKEGLRNVRWIEFCWGGCRVQF